MIIGKNIKRLIFFILLVVILMFLFKYNPYKIQFIGHYDKIWAHRVNSTEKLQWALNFFDGVELDLEYHSEADFLDVNHSPSTSINLSFEDYFKTIYKKQPFIWLDIKQLDTINSDAIFKKLKSVFESESYPINKVLIETQQPESLPIFTDYGFKTSYYLPSNLRLKDSLLLQNDILTIQKVLKSQPNIAISTDYKDYEIITKYFPNSEKYIWILVSNFNTEITQIRKILNDKTVQAVLINYHSPEGNR